jgi:restriction endonuclease S subunit
MTGNVGQRRIPLEFVKNYEIPVPSLEKQDVILTQIKKQRELVDSFTF